MRKRKEDKEYNKIFNHDRNKKRLIVVVFVGVAVALITGIIITIAFFNPFHGAKLGKDKTEKITATSSASASPKETQAKTKIKFPYVMQSWQKKYYKDQNQTTLNHELFSDAQKDFDAQVTANLPSVSDGYTNDTSKEKNSDGSLNPLFSYWTAEDFETETRGYIERLINPVYGNWYSYQYSNVDSNRLFDLSTISDMFVPDWQNNNASNQYKDYVPVYADWNSNDYGMGDTLTTSGPRWIGKIQNITSTFTYDDTNLQYNAKVDVSIVFTSLTKDGSTVQKNGTLELNLVPNTNNPSSNQRVLISSGSLKVG